MNKENQIFDQLEKFYIKFQDTKKELKEDISDVQMITASNYRDIVRLKSVK